MASHEPLCVRAYLRSGVVSDPALPLDGILLYQQMRERFGAQAATLPGGTPSAEAAPALPLAVRTDGGEAWWYYACSWAQWSAFAPGKDSWNKRLDMSHVGLLEETGHVQRVQIGRGLYRAYHMPVYYRSALWIDWFCCGEREQIAALLAPVTHIGKKRAQGWGRVMRWEIEAVAEDWSVWKGGALMRTLPVFAADGLPNRQAWYGLRPPYYVASNQTLVWMPEDDLSTKS